MPSRAVFLGVDLGASSGRVMAGRWDGLRFTVEEAHRFANGGVRLGARLYWNVLGLWKGILEGLSKFRAQETTTPAGIGVDAWGVDFGLLDGAGRLIGNPVHYRDARTQGMMEHAAARVENTRFFQATGVQPMSINTVYQLLSMVATCDEELQRARTLLSIPDLFQYFLCSQKRAEYTEATTTQLYDPARRDWAWEVLESLEIPRSIFVPSCVPATVLGAVQPSVLTECGFGAAFPAIAVASHDTASAVAAVPGMDAESVFLSCGTWSLMGTPLEQPLQSIEAFRLGFTNEGAADGGVLFLRNLTGLWILQESTRCWNAEGSGWEDLQQAASTAPPLRALIDTEAVEFQSPGDMPASIAAWCKATEQEVPQTQAEITRCILQSLALAYRRTLQDLAEVTRRSFKTVRLVGGGARNSLLCQMTADACQCVVVAGPVEATALGNVLVQAVATGHLANFSEASQALAGAEELRTYQPQGGGEWQEAAARLNTIRNTRAARQCAARTV
jgi:rhamnulokinase